MKFVLICFVTVLSIAHGQFSFNFQRRDPFKNTQSVVFTSYNEDETKGSLHYAPADPDDVVSGDNWNASRLVYTADDKVSEYRGLAISYERKKIFFNNYVSSHLIEFDVETSEMTIIANDMTSRLDSIAFDRGTDIVYWSDSKDYKIMALEKTYRHFTSIWESDVMSPRALAIHVTKRKLFFSVVKIEGLYISDAALYKCNLDGSGIEKLFGFPTVLRPRDITIDYSDDKIYWTDASLTETSVVKASDLDGKISPKEFFSTSTGQLWGIAHFKSHFYVTDMVTSTKGEYDIHIRNSDGRSGKVVKVNLRPRNIGIYAPNEVSNTRVRNECGSSTCDHICLASSSGRSTCKCALGYIKSGSTCEAASLDDNYLFIADLAHRQLFKLGLTEFGSDNPVAIDIEDGPNEKIYAASVDASNGDIVWYNMESKEIVWGSKTLSFSSSVISFVVYHCENVLYWSSGTGIYSWDGRRSSAYKTVYSLSFFAQAEVRQIDIDIIRGHIYWVEHNQATKKSEVKRCNLDGKNVEMVLENIAVSKGITIDYESYTLYVVTMVDGEIYSLPLKILEKIPSTIPTYPQYKVIKLVPYLPEKSFLIQDIVVINGWAYLADVDFPSIRRFNIRTGPSSLEAYGPEAFYYIPTLKFFNRAHYVKYIRDNCPGQQTTSTTTTTTTMPDTIIFTRRPSGPNTPRISILLPRQTRQKTRAMATTSKTPSTTSSKMPSGSLGDECDPLLNSGDYMGYLECMLKAFGP